MMPTRPRRRYGVSIEGTEEAAPPEPTKTEGEQPPADQPEGWIALTDLPSRTHAGATTHGNSHDLECPLGHCNGM